MRSCPTPASSTTRRNLSLSLAAAVALVLANHAAPAATLTWDTDPLTPGVQNGSGIWDTTGLTWSTEGATWDNSTPDSVIFGGGTGAAGTVTLGSDITVGNITFDAAESGLYTIAGGDYTLTLSNTTIDGTVNATIGATLTGNTGLTITNTASSGSRSVTLSGNNTYSGTTTITGVVSGASAAQVLRLNSTGALGNSDLVTVGNGSSLQLGIDGEFGRGKTLRITGTGVNFYGALHAASNADATWAGTVVLDGGRVGAISGGTLTLSGAVQNGTGNALTISAYGEIVLAGDQKTYTGSTEIIRGLLTLGAENVLPASTALNVDSSTADEDSIVDLNGYSQTVRALLRTNSTGKGGSFVTNNGASTATLTVAPGVNTDSPYNGIIQDGSSPIAFTKAGAGTVMLSGANTYSGATTVNEGILRMEGAGGTLASTDIRLNGGTFLLENSGAGNNNDNRLADTANVTLNGGTFHYKGSDQSGTNSSETIAGFTLGAGRSTITVQSGSTNTAILIAGQLNRENGGGTALVNGANLGSSAQVHFTSVPALFGDGTTATNKAIVPGLLGEADKDTGAPTATGTPNTFLTYDPTTGLRPLNPATDFESSMVAGANVRIGGNGTSSGNLEINSLILDAPGDTIFTLSGSSVVTNTSGMVLFMRTNRLDGGTLNFGNKEAIITANTGATALLASRIAGTGGLSFYGPGTLALGSQSTYSGETFLHSGTLAITGSSATLSNGEVNTGPFGTSTVVFAGSMIRTSEAPNDTPLTIANNIRVQADTTFGPTSGRRLVFSGPVTLDGDHTLTNHSNRGVTFSGIIGDGGQDHGFTLAGNGSGAVILSGDNTYTGPTTVRSSTLNLSGSISASSEVAVHGTGTLILSGSSAFRSRIDDDTPFTLGNTGGTGTARLTIDGSFDSTQAYRFEETVGKLTLASDAIIDFGDFGAVLRFAASQDLLWSGTLSIYNWSGSTIAGGGMDQIFFGENQFSLTPEQLAQITFYSDAGQTSLGNGLLLSTGELIPEPSTALSLVAMFGGLLGGRRLRRRVSTKG